MDFTFFLKNRHLWLGLEDQKYRKRAEYGFGEYGFKHRAQWVFSGLTEFRGPNSVSSSQPIICVQTRTHRVSRRTHRVYRRTQWVLFSETVLSKQYSTRSPKISQKNRVQIPKSQQSLKTVEDIRAVLLCICLRICTENWHGSVSEVSVVCLSQHTTHGNRSRTPKPANSLVGVQETVLLVNHAFARGTPAIFVIFVSRGLSSKALVSLVRMQIRHIRRFRQKKPSFWLDKSTVYQKHRSSWTPS